MTRYLIIGALLASSVLHGADLDSGITKISADLTTGIERSGVKKISVIDFTDLDGQESQLGRYIAEELSVSLVNPPKSFAVLDRANMKSILEEHKLTASGLVNPDNARKLGQFAGVDAIVLGNITTFGSNIVLTVKAISTETTQVLAASRVSIPRTKEMDEMLAPPAKAVVPEVSAPIVTAPPPPPPPLGDFSLPNRPVTSGDVSVELTSLRFANPDGVFAVLKVQNLKRSCPIKIGLNCDSHQIARAFLFDDRGNAFQVVGATGIGRPQSEFADQTAFYTLQIRQNGFSGFTTSTYINSMYEIGIGQSAFVTLKFGGNRDTVGSTLQLQAEIIVAEIYAESRVNLRLSNLAIDGIHTR